MEPIKDFFNLLADPRIFFLLTVGLLVVIVWKREVFVSNAVAYGIFAFLGAFFLLGFSAIINFFMFFLSFFVKFDGFSLFEKL